MLSRIRRMQTKHLVALGLVALLLIWFATGTIRSSRDAAPPVEEVTTSALATSVLVSELSVETYQAEIPVQGYLRPWEQVDLRARVSGQVIDLPVAQGTEVEAGTLLIELDAEDREARVNQLRADVELAEVELAGAQRLQREDLVSQTERLRLAANLARAQAELEAAELQLSYTQIRAPFSGLYDRRLVDRGDYLQEGQDILVFADISRLRAVASVPQPRIGSLREGLSVIVELLDGAQLEGEVIYFSRIGDAQTRSFQLEVAVENPELHAVAGASANLRIKLDPQRAYRIPPSLLRLDGDGRTMVRVVNQQDVIEEVQVDVLSMTREHAMVANLPASHSSKLRLVTQGAGLVEAGEQVAVRMEENELEGEH